jgi:hypothetical protein
MMFERARDRFSRFLIRHLNRAWWFFEKDESWVKAAPNRLASYFCTLLGHVEDFGFPSLEFFRARWVLMRTRRRIYRSGDGSVNW